MACYGCATPDVREWLCFPSSFPGMLVTASGSCSDSIQYCSKLPWQKCKYQLDTWKPLMGEWLAVSIPMLPLCCECLKPPTSWNTLRILRCRCYFMLSRLAPLYISPTFRLSNFCWSDPPIFVGEMQMFCFLLGGVTQYKTAFWELDSHCSWWKNTMVPVQIPVWHDSIRIAIRYVFITCAFSARTPPKKPGQVMIFLDQTILNHKWCLHHRYLWV